MPRHRSTTLRVDELEGRLAPADVAVLSAQLLTPTAVQFAYQTADDPGPFAVGVYRSADPAFDPSDLPVADTVVAAPGGTATVALAGEMPIDPGRPHVLVVADPADAIDESDEGNNTGSFRKLALGVVTHGFQPDGQFPTWVTAVAAALEAKGYAETIAFDWAAASRLPVPGLTTVYGTRLAGQIRLTADAVGTLPTDVVDVHLIGHSRGTVVVSQALLAPGRGPRPAGVAARVHPGDAAGRARRPATGGRWPSGCSSWPTAAG